MRQDTSVYKKNARKKPFVLECERTRKQQKRQQKQKSKEESELNKQSKMKVEETLHIPGSHKSYQKKSKQLMIVSRSFMQVCWLGPHMYVHVVTRLGLEKVFPC